MSTSPNPGAPMTDAFAQFWSDFMSRMGPPGMMPPPNAGTEATKRMQRMFFDAMAKYADDFMRSPQFLDSLKQSMDNAMAFRRQVDEWLTTSLKSAQMPTHTDVTDIVARVHSMERRVLERLDELEQRITTVEGDGAERREAQPHAGARGGAKGKSGSARSAAKD